MPSVSHNIVNVILNGLHMMGLLSCIKSFCDTKYAVSIPNIVNVILNGVHMMGLLSCIKSLCDTKYAVSITQHGQC